MFQRYRWTISPHWIVWLPGVVTGLSVACRSVGTSGDYILTTVPVYPPFLTVAGNMDRRLCTSRLNYSENGWLMDFADMEASLKPQTRMFVLCNPQNPTGRVYRKAELIELAQFCQRHDLVICSDEIHCDLILEPSLYHIPIASLSPEINQQTITLMAPSKTYNIPGLGCAFAVIANADLRKRFKRAMDGIVPFVNVLGIVAADAAYRKGQPWLDALLGYLRVSRDLVFKRINKMPGLNMTQVEATYLAWIDVRRLNLPNPDKWFEKAGVGLSNGRNFNGDGFLRMNFGCSRHLLNKALDRMARVLTNSEK
jgi:cystathionine beta-lyase